MNFVPPNSERIWNAKFDFIRRFPYKTPRIMVHPEFLRKLYHEKDELGVHVAGVSFNQSMESHKYVLGMRAVEDDGVREFEIF